MEPVSITKQQLHIINHSLGITGRTKNTNFRNYFVAGEGSSDFESCEDLVKKELMTKQKDSISPDFVYHVTEEGIAFTKVYRETSMLSGY